MMYVIKTFHTQCYFQLVFVSFQIMEVHHTNYSFTLVDLNLADWCNDFTSPQTFLMETCIDSMTEKQIVKNTVLTVGLIQNKYCKDK